MANGLGKFGGAPMKIRELEAASCEYSQKLDTVTVFNGIKAGMSNHIPIDGGGRDLLQNVIRFCSPILRPRRHRYSGAGDCNLVFYSSVGTNDVSDEVVKFTACGNDTIDAHFDQRPRLHVASNKPPRDEMLLNGAQHV